MNDFTDSMKARLDDLRERASRPRLSISAVSLAVGVLSALGGVASLYVSNERTDSAQSTRLEMMEAQFLRDRNDLREDMRALKGDVATGFARLEAKVDAGKR